LLDTAAPTSPSLNPFVSDVLLSCRSFPLLRLTLPPSLLLARFHPIGLVDQVYLNGTRH
jgi:hypothetical protein